MKGIIISTSIAFILGIVLYVLDKFLNQKKKKDYLKYLPGYNCGACGYGSCAGMEKAMQEDVMNYKKCKPLRGDALERMKEYIEK